MNRLAIIFLVLASSAMADPPMPIGSISVKTPLSPKSTEQKASLGVPMAKRVRLTVSRIGAAPSQFKITSITVLDGTVSLEWVNGVGPFKVQGSVTTAGSWNDVLTTPNQSCSFPASSNHYWRVSYVSGAPSATGDCVLQRSFGGTNGNAGTVIKGAAYRNGSLAISGLMYYTVDLGAGRMATYGGQDAFLAKYDSAGQCLWSRHLGQVSDDTANGVAIDSQGNIVVVGGFSGAIWPAMLDYGFGPVQGYGGSDIFVIKYSPAGQILWSKLFGGSGSDVANAVAVDSADNIILTGTHGFFGTGANFGGGALPTYGQQDVFLAKLAPDGGHLWSRSMGGSDSDAVTALAVTPGNEIVIAGQFRGTANFGTGPVTSAGDTDAYVGRYSSSGSNVWFKRLGDLRGQSANGVAVDAAGNAFVTGDFLGTIDFGGSTQIAALGGSFYAAKFTPSGICSWSRSFGAEVNGPHSASMAVDPQGAAVVSGEMITGIDFGYGYLLGQGGNDAMIVSFDQSGNVLWAKRGAPYGDRATASCANDSGIYVLGDCGSNPLDLGCSPIITTPGTVNNGWFVKLLH